MIILSETVIDLFPTLIIAETTKMLWKYNMYKINTDLYHLKTKNE